MKRRDVLTVTGMAAKIEDLQDQNIRLQRRLRSYETLIMEHSVPSNEKVRSILLDSCIGDISVDELHLSRKVSSLLHKRGIRNIRNLASLGDPDSLHRTKDFGQKTIIEIRDVLNEFGLALRG